MKDYCINCKKSVPTIRVYDKEECMICGTETIDKPKRSFVNETTTKSIKELTKTDPDTGKYINAQKFGRNITIGIIVILLGISYLIGGINFIFISIIFGLLLLVLASAVLYILIKSRVI